MWFSPRHGRQLNHVTSKPTLLIEKVCLNDWEKSQPILHLREKNYHML